MSNVKFTINFGDTTTYSPYEGGGTDLLPFEGMVTALIEKVVPGKSQKSGNNTLAISVLVQDADAKGKRVMKTIPVSGVRKDGKLNVQGLLDLLRSAWSMAGVSAEDVANQIAGLNNGTMDSDVMVNDLKGKLVACEIVTRNFTSSSGVVVWTSDIRNFKDRAELQKAQEWKTHRKPLSPKAQEFLDNGGAADAAAAGGAGGAPAAGAPAGGQSLFNTQSGTPAAAPGANATAAASMI